MSVVGTSKRADDNLINALVTYENVKTVVFWYIVYRNAYKLYYLLKSVGIGNSIHDAFMYLVQRLLKTVMRIPFLHKKLVKELDKVTIDIAHKFTSDTKRYFELPDNGLSQEQVESRLQEKASIKGAEWRSGKVSGAVYHGGEDIDEIWVNAFKTFSVSNPLHPDVFPGVREMESEVISMCLKLYNAPPSSGILDQSGGAGALTSGGTESIFMACKTHRDRAYAERGITEPEMVIPISAHAAFIKSAELLKISLRIIDVDKDSFQVKVSHMAKAITPNTVMIVGSAPNYGDGNIDDIQALSDLALRKKVPLHVDCCLGSFIVPYLGRVNKNEPAEARPIVDFRLPGVTSISCDTHKYGFGPKGASIVMYRSKEIRKYEYSVTTQWPGGLYGSPTLAGSRPGAVIAGTWAAMLYMGDSGYEQSAREIVGAARKIKDTIRTQFPELMILGDPHASVVAFTSETVSIYEVSDAMSDLGWHLASLQNPAACHIAVTRPIVPAIPQFFVDLRKAIDTVSERTSPEDSQLAQIYGLGKSTAVGPHILKEVLQRYIDVTLSA